ncbi:hypothetical protein ACFV98_24850 [Streptomyces violascens]|uniref:hypothetical protein n=1 Tax=Streptomyces violascens TaxID=67381 RepID=UPI003664ED4B
MDIKAIRPQMVHRGFRQHPVLSRQFERLSEIARHDGGSTSQPVDALGSKLVPDGASHKVEDFVTGDGHSTR